MSKKYEQTSVEVDKALHTGSVMWRLFIIPLWFAICLNLGKAMAYLIWNLIMWLGVLPYLEKFFGWFVWF